MDKAFAPLRWLAGLLLALMVLAAITPAIADEAADKLALDQLFAELKAAPDAATAHQIDQRIWTLWTNPSDHDLSLRMMDVLEARSILDLHRALVLLDTLVADYPAYAEGWNQRATIYYMLGNYDASLADIDKVLQYEPRHFGALSGRALIYLSQGKRALAIKDMAAALAVHPFLSEKELFPELQQNMTRI